MRKVNMRKKMRTLTLVEDGATLNWAEEMIEHEELKYELEMQEKCMIEAFKDDAHFKELQGNQASRQRI